MTEVKGSRTETAGKKTAKSAKKTVSRRVVKKKSTGTAKEKIGQVQQPVEAVFPAPKPEVTPKDATPVPGAPTAARQLDDCAYYLNRELTWLNFNFRVLAEAESPDAPLLERAKFVSIVSSNLDEFFMKRIGGLKQQVGAGLTDLSVDGRTPQQQIDECAKLVKILEKRKRKAFLAIKDELSKQEIDILAWDDVSDEQKVYLRDYYASNVYPLVTPQATDPAHPFPFISNLSLNLLVSLRHPGTTDISLARVKVPVGAGIDRFVRLPERNALVPLEIVIRHNLDMLFPGMEIVKCEMFRVIRNANTELDEEAADDLLAMIETELRERKFASTVRLEVESTMGTVHRGMLSAELGLDEFADVYEVEGIMALRDIMELLDFRDNPDLFDSPHHPVDNPILATPGSIFHTIRNNGSILLMHPYESFGTSVERFLCEASQDPKVRAIKMTLYRTSAETKAIRYLMDAARNGKQVAVVMELKARFDEAANIGWANHLEQVGIHVTYGVVGLKTHCKAILVVRQDYTGIKRYAHIGTGNYHAGTARLYSDVGMLTSDEKIGEDLTELFNYLTTGYKPKRTYNKILPAPKVMKPALLEKIEREIKNHTAETPGRIVFKMNALEDPAIVKALYGASQAGVKVELVIRDTCRLRPGIKGLSETTRVVSVVGRFLEHARVYYFHNSGDEEFFIGSADCMKRNLDSRVEIFAPVEEEGMRSELRLLLEAQLADTRGAWEMNADGSYRRVLPSGGAPSSSQVQMIARAEDRLKEVTRLKRRKPRGLKRNVKRA